MTAVVMCRNPPRRYRSSCFPYGSARASGRSLRWKRWRRLDRGVRGGYAARMASGRAGIGRRAQFIFCAARRAGSGSTRYHPLRARAIRLLSAPGGAKLSTALAMRSLLHAGEQHAAAFSLCSDKRLGGRDTEWGDQAHVVGLEDRSLASVSGAVGDCLCGNGGLGDLEALLQAGVGVIGGRG